MAGRILLALFFVTGFFTTNLFSADSIVIGLIPEMNVFKQHERFRPLAGYLTRKLRVEVKFTILSRYGNIIESFREKKIDAAFLGSFTGALSIYQLGVIPLVRPVNLDGTSTYFGHIFVRQDSRINTVADMKDKTMVFVEQATTAGFIFPLAYLQKNGVTDYKSYFREYFFAGSHDAAIDAVLKGNADIGAAKNTILNQYIETNPKAKRELIILANSEQVPSNGLCVLPDMSSELRTKIEHILMTMKDDADGIRVLKSLRFLDFVKTGKDDYQVVMDMARQAGISLETYNYTN